MKIKILTTLLLFLFYQSCFSWWGSSIYSDNDEIFYEDLLKFNPQKYNNLYLDSEEIIGTKNIKGKKTDLKNEKYKSIWKDIEKWDNYKYINIKLKNNMFKMQLKDKLDSLILHSKFEFQSCKKVFEDIIPKTHIDKNNFFYTKHDKKYQDNILLPYIVSEDLRFSKKYKDKMILVTCNYFVMKDMAKVPVGKPLNTFMIEIVRKDSAKEIVPLKTILCKFTRMVNNSEFNVSTSAGRLLASKSRNMELNNVEAKIFHINENSNKVLLEDFGAVSSKVTDNMIIIYPEKIDDISKDCNFKKMKFIKNKYEINRITGQFKHESIRQVCEFKDLLKNGVFISNNQGTCKTIDKQKF